MANRRRWTQGIHDSGMTPEKLEGILRHYADFRAIQESTGQDEFLLPDGMTLNILDLDQGIRELPPRQRVALTLTCIYNHREVDAARLMGFKGTKSPVGTYKKLALRKLVDRYWATYGEGDGTVTDTPTPRAVPRGAGSNGSRPADGHSPASEGLGVDGPSAETRLPRDPPVGRGQADFGKHRTGGGRNGDLVP